MFNCSSEGDRLSIFERYWALLKRPSSFTGRPVFIVSASPEEIGDAAGRTAVGGAVSEYECRMTGSGRRTRVPGMTRRVTTLRLTRLGPDGPHEVPEASAEELQLRVRA